MFTLRQMRIAAASVAIALTFALAGCAATILQPVLPNNADEVSIDADAALDVAACKEFSTAFTAYTKSVDSNSSASAFSAAYRELAFTIGSVAIEAADDSEIETALQELSVASAAQADALSDTGTLSTQQNLAFQTAVNTAMEACGRPPVTFLP